MAELIFGEVGAPPDLSAVPDPEIPRRFYWDSINNPGGEGLGVPRGVPAPKSTRGVPNSPSGAVLALGAAQGDGDVVVLEVTGPGGTPKVSNRSPKFPKFSSFPIPEPSTLPKNFSHS